MPSSLRQDKTSANIAVLVCTYCTVVAICMIAFNVSRLRVLCLKE
jgi:hypothetical protein